MAELQHHNSVPASGRAVANVRPGPCRPFGFTLIELLVVVAIIALLIGLLLPSIASVRSLALLLENKSNQRQLAMGQIAFTADNREEYASVHTGPNRDILVALRNGHLARDLMEGNTTPSTPTSTVDWISPALGAELDLSPNRAERTYQIFSRFSDPTATRPNDFLYGLASAGDRADFDAIQNVTPYPQMSYLAPSTFHYGGCCDDTTNNRNGGILLGRTPTGDPIWGQNNFDTPFNMPDDFSPRLDKVGSPSMKIVLADGTRYFTNAGLLDFDVDATPSFFGSFLTNTPMWRESRAYRMPDPTFSTSIMANERFGDYEQWRLSVRHLGNTRMTVALFDGHVEALTIEEAYGNVDRWAPRGSIIWGEGFGELNRFAREYVQSSFSTVRGKGGGSGASGRYEVP